MNKMRIAVVCVNCMHAYLVESDTAIPYVCIACYKNAVVIAARKFSIFGAGLWRKTQALEQAVNSLNEAELRYEEKISEASMAFNHGEN